MNGSSLALLAQDGAVVSDEWSELFFGLGHEQRFPLIIIAIGCLTAIVIVLICTIAGLINKAGESRLKRELIDRGMSAEEIAMIVESTPPDNFLEREAINKKRGGG